MTINDSQLLAGHSSSISTLTVKSSLKIQITKCKRDLLTLKERRHTACAVEKKGIVDLVLKAWDESFAHIVVAEKGWVPLNNNLLLHPEIQLASTSNLQSETNNNQPVSSIPPSGLNLSQGITATLVDQIVQYSNLEDARNGIHLDKLACQRKETALEAISSNKRYTAGLHVAAGRYLLPEVFYDQLKKKRHAEEV